MTLREKISRFVQRVTARSDKVEFELLQAALDGVDSAIFLIDPDGRVALANKTARDLTSAASDFAEWLFEGPFHALGDKHILSEAENPTRCLLLNARSDDIVVGWLSPSRTEYVLRFSASRTGIRGLTVLSVSDETIDWLSRENLGRSEHMDRIAQLVSGMAHDLGNVLGTAQLSAETGLLTKADASAARKFQAIKLSCQRGVALTDRLMTLTREANDTADRADVVAIVEDSAELARSARPADVEISLTGSREDPVMARCRPADLQAAILNLILNAKHAVTDANRVQGEISVGWHLEDGNVCIVVADNGIGMAPDVLKRATDPFFTTRRAGGGTGLGLTVTADFARRSQGNLTLASSQGEGTTAELILPMTASEAHHVQIPSETLTKLEGLRVLLVEKEPFRFGDLALALKTLGTLPAIAKTADDAGTKFDATAFDALLVDVDLGTTQDGYALAELLTQRNPDVAVMYLVEPRAHIDLSQQRVPGLYLRKPIGAFELANSLELITRTQRPREGLKDPGVAEPISNLPD